MKKNRIDANTLHARLETQADECALTSTNLCLLGLYDEAYSMYERIMDVHEKVIEENKHPVRNEVSIDMFRLRDVCRPTVKKILNPFFKERVRFFTDDYPVLYVNTDCLRGIYFLRTVPYKKNERYSDNGCYLYRYRRMDADTFFQKLVLIAARLIHTKKQYEGGRNSLVGIYNQINNRIQKAATDAWHERKAAIVEEYECPQLLVFKSLHQASCVRDGHDVVPSEQTILLSGNSNKAVRLPVHECRTCGKRFIGYETYRLFTREYGILIFERIPDVGMAEGEFADFHRESQFHRHGYNVVAGMLTERERRSILVTLLRRKIMSYAAICRDIEFAIKLFQGRERFKAAVEKWESDLVFLGEYVLEGGRG